MGKQVILRKNNTKKPFESVYVKICEKPHIDVLLASNEIGIQWNELWTEETLDD